MFGIVPRPVWARVFPPDERGRITLETNLLVLKDGGRCVLVDTGMGDKWSEKEADIFAVRPPSLEDSLAAVGVTPADVTDVFLTHLHFDHAGGLTRRTADGELALRFENARVHVGRRNFEWAQTPSPRDAGSYRQENWAPLLDEPDRLILVDDEPGRDTFVMDDLYAVACEGHTTGQLLPWIGAGDERLLYAADMIPTRAHVRVPWNMAYDLRPLAVMEEKRALLERCAEAGALLLLEHDPEHALVRVTQEGEKFSWQPAFGGET